MSKMSSCYTCAIVNKVSTNCQPGVRFVSSLDEKYASHLCVCICNFFGWRDEFQKKYCMKFYEFYELMIFFYELMNWWKNGEVLIIDNHHHVLPINSFRYYYLQYLKLVYNKYKAAYLRWLKSKSWQWYPIWRKIFDDRVCRKIFSNNLVMIVHKCL